jgi:hypothetical protein
MRQGLTVRHLEEAGSVGDRADQLSLMDPMRLRETSVTYWSRPPGCATAQPDFVAACLRASSPRSLIPSGRRTVSTPPDWIGMKPDRLPDQSTALGAGSLGGRRRQAPRKSRGRNTVVRPRFPRRSRAAPGTIPGPACALPLKNDLGPKKTRGSRELVSGSFTGS